MILWLITYDWLFHLAKEVRGNVGVTHQPIVDILFAPPHSVETPQTHPRTIYHTCRQMERSVSEKGP